MTYDYPHVDDPELQNKIYTKREFYYHRIAPKLAPFTPEEIDKYRNNVCSGKMRVQSHQAFLAEFINPETPYTGLLVFHGTGSGKTFGAISIAERFKEQVQRYGTKITIVVPGPILKEQFKNDLITITTNYAYMPMEYQSSYESLPESLKKKARDFALRSASQYYQIMSYKSFHRKVLGEKIKRGEKIVRHFSANRIENLDNSVLIIDEAHNLTNNEYGEALQYIREKSTNLRVVLLTATPMKNTADEIVSLLNFLRPMNDPIERSRTFQGSEYDMTFTPEGKNYLRRMASGYVSYYKGENPYTFARRDDQGSVPPELIFTPLVKCKMKPFQEKYYKQVLDEFRDALDKNSEAASNFIFPVIDRESGKLTGVYGHNGIRTVLQQLTNKDLQDLVSDYFSIPGDSLYISRESKRPFGKIFELPYLYNFSTKFATCMENLLQLHEGTAFIYSNLVQVGTNLFRDVLLANGFLDYNAEGKYQYNSSTLSFDLKMKYSDYVRSGDKEKAFKPATFLVVSGGGEVGDDLPSDKVQAIQQVFNSFANVEGSQIKIVLGSRVVNEGVTFENVREVHVLDVHYHLGRLEQVIGRTIRQCRHIRITGKNGSPSPKVKVFRYALSFTSFQELTRDEILYQKAEIKFITIKSTERILKECAIDCPLNFAANQIVEDIVKYKGCCSVNEILNNPNLKQSMCPARCDFDDCRYKCGDHTLNLNYYDRDRNIYRSITKSHLDFGTFSRRNARLEVDFCKSIIKDLFSIEDEYTIQQMVSLVKEYYPQDKLDLFDEFFLLRALTELMPVSDSAILNFSDYVINKRYDKGYLIYCKNVGLYKFKPLESHNNTSSMKFGNKSLNNYLGHSDDKPEVKERYRFATNEIPKTENFIVGVIDDDEKGNELFKIRPPRSTKVGSKKREKGLPSEKGSVCHFSRTIEELRRILVKLGFKKIPDGWSRFEICEEIKKRLIELEKSVGDAGIPDKKYIYIPENHPTIPYPLKKTS